MLKVTGSQEGGWIGQFPEGTVGGQWRWDLMGPTPQTLLKDDGGPAEFLVDESVEANRGEYTLSVQRLDANGQGLGDNQVSASFLIDVKPPAFVNIEVAGPVTVTVAQA